MPANLASQPQTTHVSEIEDGFAMKRQRDKARPGSKKRTRTVRGDHTIPPPPVKHILASFTLANPTSKRAKPSVNQL
jgi:hypothetical protein